jgi:hypothetical protein
MMAPWQESVDGFGSSVSLVSLRLIYLHRRARLPRNLSPLLGTATCLLLLLHQILL